MSFGFRGFPNPPRVRGTVDWALGKLPTSNVGYNRIYEVTDGSDATQGDSTTTASPQYLQIDLGVPRFIVHSRVLYGDASHSSGTGALLGSSDGVNWTVIQQWAGITTPERTHYVNGWWRFFRLNTVLTGSPGSTGMDVKTWSLFG